MRKQILAVTIGVLLVLSVFSVFRFWQIKPAQATGVFSDGQVSSTMETVGDLSAWTTTVVTDGGCSIAVDTAEYHHGGNSSKSIVNAGSKNAAAQKTLDSTYGTLFLRFYAKLNKLPTDLGTVGFGGIRESGDGTYQLAIYNNSGTYQMQIYNAHLGTSSRTNLPSGITAGTWHCYEQEIIRSATVGQILSWYDGTACTVQTGIDTGDTDFDSIRLGTTTVTSIACTNWFDCVIVDTAYIGPELNAYTIKGGVGVYNGTENVSPYKTTSGSDANTVISTVIGWMNASYPTVEFIGTFSISSTINIAKSITMDFSVATVTITTATWVIYPTVNITVDGGHFIGGVAMTAMLTGTGGSHSIFENIDFDATGLLISGSHNVTVNNCTFHNVVGGWSLQMGGVSVGDGGNIIQNCKFHDLSGTSQLFAQEHGADSNQIINCEFYNANNHAIYFDYISGSNGGTTVRDCTFHDNILPTAAALHIKTPHNKIYNNTFTDWGISISLYSELTGYEANDNNIYNNTFDTCTYGLWIGHDTANNAPTLRNLVHNNTFISVTSCITLLATSNTVEDTEIYDNDFQATCTNVFPASAYNVTLIERTLVYNNDFNTLSVGSAITNFVNTFIYNNTAMTGYYMLNLTSVGAGFTSPLGIGWQYYSGTSASVIWTPNSGYSRVDFEIDGVNQTTTTSPISITMSADHNGTAYFSGSPPPIILTITSPTNTTYSSSTVSVELSASGGTVDTIIWNCTYTNSTVAYSNQTYTVLTSMTLYTGSYIFYAVANNTDGNSDAVQVWFTVTLEGGITEIIVSTWWSGWW